MKSTLVNLLPSKIRHASAIRFVNATLFDDSYRHLQNPKAQVYLEEKDLNYKVWYLISQEPQLLENTYILDIHVRAWGLTLDYLPEPAPKYKVHVELKNGERGWRELTLKELICKYHQGKIIGAYIEKLIWLPQNFTIAAA